MISVIVLTYNDPLRLRLCLHSLLRQTSPDFELVVVHDGGDRQINQPVYDEMQRHGREISELWLGPESSAFRAAAARNLGLRHIHGERVLFLDGDCILAQNVVAEHATYTKTNLVVGGARNHLPEECVAWLQPEHFDQLQAHVIASDYRYVAGGRIYDSLRAQLLKGETVIPLTHFEHIWSFQLSVPTHLARQIGGFNEEFVGYGGEDQEFAARLLRAGAPLLGRFDLLSYHLNHPSNVNGRKYRDWISHTRESARRPDPVRNGGPLSGSSDAWASGQKRKQTGVKSIRSSV